MNKTPTTLIIMDGFGLRQDDGRQRHPRRRHAPAGPVFPGVCPHHPPGLRPGRGPAGRTDGQQRGGPHQHRRRPGGVPGPAPDHQGHCRRETFFRNPAYRHAMDACLEKGTSLHLMGLLSDGGVHSHLEHLFALLQLAKDRGLEQGLYPRLPGRPGRLSHLRRGLCGADRGKVPGDRRGQDRHGHGPVLCHGPGQALGPGGDGL